MSFSGIYLSRRFLLQNYRDFVAMALIGSFVVNKAFNKVAKDRDNAIIQAKLIALTWFSCRATPRTRATSSTGRNTTRRTRRSRGQR